jgi:hypothetical protein
MHKKHLFKWVWMLFFFTGEVNANEILVNTQDGEMFVVDIDPSESLQDLQDKIATLTQGRESHALMSLSGANDLREFCLKQGARGQGQYLGYSRNYFVDVTPSEKADIRFIVSSLANKSLISIAFMKGDIEAAGDRIDHLHPLRFLMTIFSDEELKVLIRNIRVRGWIWSHFLGGLKESLATETSIGNMRVDYVLHFSEQLKISPNLISDSIFSQMWDDFVDLLIAHIPRAGDHDRYDG